MTGKSTGEGEEVREVSCRGWQCKGTGNGRGVFGHSPYWILVSLKQAEAHSVCIWPFWVCMFFKSSLPNQGIHPIYYLGISVDVSLMY